MSEKMDYWKECISEALEDAGIKASDEQIDTVTSWVEGAHENYGMAHGHDCIPNPMVTENEDLKKKLKREQEKTICEECNGKGTTISYGGTFQCYSRCYVCRGEGFIYR
jgi:hypothetical protein